MPSWVRAVGLDDLKRRRKLAVTVGDVPLALFWHRDRPYALANICIHRERELAKGVILNDRVICPGHQWAFDLETGYEAKMERYQPTYAVKVEDGAVFVDLDSGRHEAGERSAPGTDVR